jgi:hypothetical protein
MIRPLQRAWRRVRHGEPVIIVSGLPRSGTSMIMQMLEAGGVPLFTDRIREPDESNPRGYFELERVKGLEEGDIAWVADARGKAVKVIAYLLDHLPSSFHYRVLFIIRNLEEVLDSQARMLARRGESAEGDEERMREILYGDLARARRLLARDHRFEVLHLRHEQVLDDPRSAASQIARFIGGRLDAEAMAGAVDRSLHRSRLKS